MLRQRVDPGKNERPCRLGTLAGPHPAFDRHLRSNHDSCSRRTSVTDANNKTTSYAYDSTPLPELLAELDRCLRPFAEDPPEDVALPAADDAATIARLLVEEIAKVGYRGDRLGQCIRNLFECLGLPEEGAELSLRCGERPDSPLRP